MFRRPAKFSKRLSFGGGVCFFFLVESIVLGIVIPRSGDRESPPIAKNHPKTCPDSLNNLGRLFTPKVSEANSYESLCGCMQQSPPCLTAFRRLHQALSFVFRRDFLRQALKQGMSLPIDTLLRRALGKCASKPWDPTVISCSFLQRACKPILLH